MTESDDRPSLGTCMIPGCERQAWIAILAGQFILRYCEEHWRAHVEGLEQLRRERIERERP